MLILPEAGTENTIPYDRTFENLSTIYTVNRLYLSFLLMPVCQMDIKKWVVNESQKCPLFLLANT